jgi:predicted transcriptional regulator
LATEKHAVEEAPLSFKVPTELIGQLDAIARKDERSRSAVVRIALTQFIERSKRNARDAARKAKGTSK